MGKGPDYVRVYFCVRETGTVQKKGYVWETYTAQILIKDSEKLYV